ncbi:hypothetical protein AN401_07190 [Zobellella denitrificans]|uniref:DUF2730 domain-containing protein n=1 Tax=Zobellella denitrificans TaxID=347534 RepID=A0A291HNC6_9GAMM|nr:DUF2730 family protein [Zobellella denitrificans]ATG73667.1 hypothetical protein AN401_07190 [Zobellella denitrificans]
MMEYNWTAIRFAFDVFQALFMTGVAIYVWWTRRTSATAAEINGLKQRITEVDSRAARIEQALEHRPGHGDIDELRGELAQTNRALAELGAQLQGTTALLHRLHEYLLTERSKS